jgi:drug/metabolite transporter (DMT)-like permease
MEAWIAITIAAAFLQNLRSALQKHLQGSLGTTGASFVRFGFGFPLAIAYVLGLHYFADYAFPQLNGSFAFWAVLGGLAQIFATILLVYLFSLRNFAVGTAYSKTEPVQAAIFGLILLGERLTPGAIAAIIVGVVGVMMISVARMPLSWRNLLVALTGRTALIGIASGLRYDVPDGVHAGLDGDQGQKRNRPCGAVLAVLGACRAGGRHRISLLVHGDDLATGGLCAGARADRAGLHLHGLDLPVP